MAAPVTVASDGQPVMPIVAGSAAEPVTDLQQMLRQITGAEFRVLQAIPAGQGAIYVGTASDFPDRNFENITQLGAEGFIIRSDGTNLFLVGNQPLGVQHAVTTFLQKLGARWFFPGKEWEVIPELKTIKGDWNERQSPSFRTQRSIWYGFGAYPKTAADTNVWNLRNRMGGPKPISIGHTWYGINPDRDIQTHPEWFALIKGERKKSKPCFSDPGLIQQLTKYALEQAAGGEKSISMTPADGLGYCECDRCKAVFQGGEPFAAHGSLFAKRPDGVTVNITSETLFNAVNQVARAVAKQYPDVQLACYSYSAYSHPPSFKMEPNVYIQSTTAYQRTPLSGDELLEAWGKLASDLGIRGYWSVYQWDWDNPGPGITRPYNAQSDLKRYREHNVTAFNTEASNNWGPRGLGYYVGANLMWNVDADIKVLVRDFYEKAFGPAAAPMERYYVMWYGKAAQVGLNPGDPEPTWEGKTYIRSDVAGSRESMREAFQYLTEASKAAANDSAVTKRIDHMRMYAYYLYLRLKTWEAVQTKDDEKIIEAVMLETIFGAHLADTNMIHTRALVGKAFHRHFSGQMKLLGTLPKEEVDSWKKLGPPPTHDELEPHWIKAKAELDK
jgi:hypothetical protein